LLISEGYGSWIAQMFYHQNPNLVSESVQFDPLHEKILEKTNYLSYSNLMKGYSRFWLICTHLGLMELILANPNSYLRKTFIQFINEKDRRVMRFHLRKPNFWNAQILERNELENSYQQLNEVMKEDFKPKMTVFLSNVTKISTFYQQVPENIKVEITSEENYIKMLNSDEIRDKCLKILKMYNFEVDSEENNSHQ
jgi:hypothetical protein